VHPKKITRKGSLVENMVVALSIDATYRVNEDCLRFYLVRFVCIGPTLLYSVHVYV